VTRPLVGLWLMTLLSGTMRLPGCRFISLQQFGRVSHFALSTRSEIISRVKRTETCRERSEPQLAFSILPAPATVAR
jgi:hypothetical protein